METKEEKTNSNERITLVSKEGVPYYLKRSAVEKSPVLKMILQRGIEEKTKTINLQEIDTGTVRAVQLLTEAGTGQQKIILQQMVANKTKEEVDSLDKAMHFLDLKELRTSSCSHALKAQLLQKVFPKMPVECCTVKGGPHTLPGIVIDGSNVITCDGYTLKILDKYTGKELRKWEVDREKSHGGFSCITVDSKSIICGFQDGTLKIWDKHTLKEQRTFEARTAKNERWPKVACLAIDNDYIVSGWWDGTIKIWDKDTGIELQSLNGHWYSVDCIVVDKDYIISGSYNTLKIWDKHTGKELHTLTHNQHSFHAHGVVIDGDRVIAGAGNTLKIWDKYTGQELDTLDVELGQIYSVAVDSKYIIAGFSYGLQIWDKHTLKKLHNLERDKVIYCVALDGVHIISGTMDNIIKIWDLTNVNEFEQFLSALSLQYAHLLSQFAKIIVSNNNNATMFNQFLSALGKVTALIDYDNANNILSVEELNLYEHFLNTIKENWGAEVQEAIRQTLDQYRQGVK